MVYSSLRVMQNLYHQPDASPKQVIHSSFARDIYLQVRVAPSLPWLYLGAVVNSGTTHLTAPSWRYDYSYNSASRAFKQEYGFVGIVRASITNRTERQVPENAAYVYGVR